MTHPKVFHVSYHHPQHQLQIFWAQDVWEIAGSFRFVGCRVKAARLMNITIPTTLTPTVVECDPPDWWDRYRNMSTRITTAKTPSPRRK